MMNDVDEDFYVMNTFRLLYVRKIERSLIKC